MPLTPPLTFFSFAKTSSPTNHYTMPPPRIPKPGKKKKKAVEPTTASEYLDAGVDEEEHGDRWIDSGDIPKAIRFYQKAARYYQQAISLAQQAIPGPAVLGSRRVSVENQQIRDDATYNLARMQYVLYTKVVKTGELDSLDAGRLGVPLDGSGIVPASIQQVLQMQELALNTVQQSSGSGAVPLDQLYTYGQVLAEAGEDAENSEAVQRAAECFQTILERQLVALCELEEEEVEESAATNSAPQPDSQQSEKTIQLSTTDGVVPSSVVETVTSLLDTLNIVLELSRDDTTPFIKPQPQVALSLQATAATVVQLLQLLAKYNAGTTENKFLAIPQEPIDDAYIAIAQLLSTCSESVDTLLAVWTAPALTPVQSLNPADSALQALATFIPKVLGDAVATQSAISLPRSVPRYLAATDALFGYAERVGVAPEDRWSAYSKALAVLKQAWELVMSAAEPPVPVSPLEKLQVLIARGDAELLRASLVGVAAADKHRTVLRKNARNMYQSADNLQLVATPAATPAAAAAPQAGSDGNGGGMKLTSSSPDILRLKREIKIKMALLDGKTGDPLLAAPSSRKILQAIQDAGGLGLIGSKDTLNYSQ